MPTTRRSSTLIAVFVAALCLNTIGGANYARADRPSMPAYKKPPEETLRGAGEEASVSPKQGWKSLPQREKRVEHSTPWWAHVVLWIPNRIMDLIDVFRVDVGAGPAVGGVIRVTQSGQAGYRRMLPFSLRVGDFGRKAPFLVETDDEDGAGRKFKKSDDRELCVGEIGLGLDLGLGAYAGICSEELLDFFAGLFFIDLEADDIQ